MERDSPLPPNEFDSRLPVDEAVSNPENYLSYCHIGNPRLENNGFWLNNHPRNQSFANNFRYGENMDPRSLFLMEAQLRGLRIDAAARGQVGNSTSQQIPSGDYGIGIGCAYNLYGGRMFMRHKYSNLTSLEDVRGIVVSVCTDEYGCQFLLKALDEGNPQDIAFILLEVMDHLHDLMMDDCGSRVVQKLFETVSVDQMTNIVDLIIVNEYKFEDVCINSYGTRTIQKLVNHLTTREQLVHFTRALRRITVTLTTSLNGGYVIQQCLKLFPAAFSKVILDEIAYNCIGIARDKVGCSVLQRCLTNAEAGSMMLLVHAIILHALVLAQDLYGNYVVQFLIKMEIASVNAAIVQQLHGKYVELSTNKYASNVVEDLLGFSSQSHAAIIIQEIMDSPNFVHVLLDPYGNYVAQRALKYSTGYLRNSLLQKIGSYYLNLRSDPFGKRVLAFAKGCRFRAQNV